jgi:hypothetical protein
MQVIEFRSRPRDHLVGYLAGWDGVLGWKCAEAATETTAHPAGRPVVFGLNRMRVAAPI